MQTVTDTFDQIFQGEHRTVVTVVVGGREFGMDSIVSLTTYSNLFSEDKPMIGSCVSAEVELSFFPGDFVPPRNAEIDIFVNVVSLDGQVAPRIPKGVFFTDTRTIDPTTGVCTLHGYDAMLRAEQPYLGEVIADDWPKLPHDVVIEIAEKMGVQRYLYGAAVNDDYLVELPLGYSCREVLGHIAAANAANWIITDDGKLRLIPLAEMAEATSFLVDGYGNYLTIGGKRIRV